MAYQDAANKDAVRMAGEYGNLACEHETVTLASAAVGDKSRLLKIPAGSKLTDAKLAHEALGASTTVSLGLEYADGSTGGVEGDAVVAAAAASSSAGVIRMDAAPISIDKDMYLIAVVGGAVATGKIDAVASYVYQGTL